MSRAMSSVAARSCRSNPLTGESVVSVISTRSVGLCSRMTPLGGFCAVNEYLVLGVTVFLSR